MQMRARETITIAGGRQVSVEDVLGKQVLVRVGSGSVAYLAIVKDVKRTWGHVRLKVVPVKGIGSDLVLPETLCLIERGEECKKP